MPDIKKSETLHASCVSVGTSAVLILGKSGAGKSALALELMGYGATLVADDRTVVEATEYGLKANCPASIQGKIEARGVGILLAEYLAYSYIRLVVDLDKDEADRLPPKRNAALLGLDIPLLYKPVHDHFPAAILQYLKAGRSA
ncbi:MAG: HPr kinase/phosphorylase [Paracoccaceae bacterium]